MVSYIERYTAEVKVKNIKTGEITENLFNGGYDEKPKFYKSIDEMELEIYRYYNLRDLKVLSIKKHTVAINEVVLQGTMRTLINYDDKDLYFDKISLMRVIDSLELNGCKVILSIKIIEDSIGHPNDNDIQDDEIVSLYTTDYKYISIEKDDNPGHFIINVVELEE